MFVQNEYLNNGCCIMYTQDALATLTDNELRDKNMILGTQTPLKEAVFEAILQFERGTRGDAQRILVIYGDGIANVACTRCPNRNLSRFFVNETTDSGFM